MAADYNVVAAGRQIPGWCGRFCGGEEVSITTVRSVTRALNLLDLLAETQNGLGVLDLAEQTELNGSTAHRLLGTLMEQGYVRQDPGSKKYLLGPQCLRLGSAALSHFDIRNSALDLLRELAAQVRELTNLAVLTGSEAMYVAQVPASRPVQMFTQLGSRVPLHCTGVGKAILAYLPTEEVRTLLAGGLPSFTRNTVTSLADLDTQLRAIREAGWAVDNEEREIGVRCVAGPIFGAGGRIVGAISVSGPSGRVSPERDPELGQIVQLTANAISRRMGFDGQDALERVVDVTGDRQRPDDEEARRPMGGS